MGASEDVTQGLDEVFRSNYVSGKAKQSYKQQNPAEFARVDAYLKGGALPSPFPTTLMGSGLTKLERGRRALVAPPPDPEPEPEPPPSSETPWQGYRYEVSMNQITLPDRHFTYHADGSCSLTCFTDTPKLGTDRQLVSVYNPTTGHAAEGKRARYETTITFPSDFKGTTGELNWWFEWHTMTGQGAGQLSCAIGGRCDYPVSLTEPGKNLTWFFRPTGPNGSPPLAEMIGPPIQVGRSYAVRVEITWSSTAGRFTVWLDGTQVRDWQMPTLWTGDTPIIGVYHYRLAIPLTTTLRFSKPVVTAL